jgi:hypothetical protein
MHTARARDGGRTQSGGVRGCSPLTTDTSFFFLAFFLSTRFGSVLAFVFFIHLCIFFTFVT